MTHRWQEWAEWLEAWPDLALVVAISAFIGLGSVATLLYLDQWFDGRGR